MMMSRDPTCGSATGVSPPFLRYWISTDVTGRLQSSWNTVIVRLFTVDFTARQNVAVADDAAQWSRAVLAVIIVLPSAPSPTLIPCGDMSRPGARKPLARRRSKAFTRAKPFDDCDRETGRDERGEWVSEWGGMLRRNSQQRGADRRLWTVTTDQTTATATVSGLSPSPHSASPDITQR